LTKAALLLSAICAPVSYNGSIFIRKTPLRGDGGAR
jgi:hypothetical protein